MPFISHPNAAVCPACGWKNNIPLECLRGHWQRDDCQRCRKPFEYRGRATGPGRPEDGDFTIDAQPPKEAK